MVFGVCLFLVTKLEVSSNMDDMLPKDSDYLKATDEFDQYFESQEQVVVLLGREEGFSTEAFDEHATAMLNELSDKLSDEAYVSSLFYKIDMGELEPYLWAYLDLDVYDALDEAVASQSQAAITEVLKSISELAAEEVGGSRYLVSEKGDHYMMVIRPVLDQSEFEKTRMDFWNGLNETIDDLKGNKDYIGIDVGVTGGAFVQDIEADTVAFQGMDRTLIVTLLIIIIMAGIFFKSIRLPALSVYPLILGAVGASAAAYLMFGGINMFSVSFALLLLGLGIDFAVHLLARYQEERDCGADKATALVTASKSTGSSIIIGAATTAFAFATFGLAKFRAFTQMGTISAVGVMLLCIAMLVLMPALVTLFDRKKYVSVTAKQSIGRVILSRYTKWMMAKPVLIVVVIIGVGALLFSNVTQTEIRGEVSAIYPDNIPSLEYTEILENEFDYSSNSLSVFFDDMVSLKAGIGKLESVEGIASVQSVLDFMPDDQEEKLQRLKVLYPVLEAVGAIEELDLKLELLTPEMMPEVIRTAYVGGDGRLLVEIMPSIDLFDREQSEPLVQSVEEITGHSPVGMAMVMNEITGLVIDDIYKISILCMAAIFTVGLVTFRRLSLALLTALPISATVYMTLGLLPILGIDLNLFSIASIPLIIGIGVDSGIHLIHRLKEERTTAIPVIIGETGRAIVLTTFTTMVGFGSLASINHPGMSNFGLVVVVGMAVNLVMTISLVPAVMHMFRLRLNDPIVRSGRIAVNADVD